MEQKKETAATPTTFGLTKYVHVMFFAGALVVGWLFVKIIDNVWTSLNLTFTAVPAPRYWWVIVAGGGLAAATAAYMWRHPKVNRLAVEIVTELSKVTWPTRKELSVSTVVVLVVSVIAAVILGLFDLFWSWLTGLVL